MHAVLTPPPKNEPQPPYYLMDLNGGKPKEFPDQWQALMYGYLNYGMAKFRVLTEAEMLTAT